MSHTTTTTARPPSPDVGALHLSSSSAPTTSSTEPSYCSLDFHSTQPAKDDSHIHRLERLDLIGPRPLYHCDVVSILFDPRSTLFHQPALLNEAREWLYDELRVAGVVGSAYDRKRGRVLLNPGAGVPGWLDRWCEVVSAEGKKREVIGRKKEVRETLGEVAGWDNDGGKVPRYGRDGSLMLPR